MITGAAIFCVGLLVGCLVCCLWESPPPKQRVLNQKLNRLFTNDKATIVDMKNPLDIQL